MQSTFNYHTPSPLPQYDASNGFFDDISTQIALSRAGRRTSRGSTGQRSGSAMRVVKPTSTSNSPRSAMMNIRRQTMLFDSQPSWRTQQMMSSMAMTPSSDTLSQKPSRPVSWHPSTYLQPPQRQAQQHHQPQQSYPISTQAYPDHYDSYFTQPQFSPMATSYSNDTSPSTTFSPLPLAYAGVETSQFPGQDAWDYAASNQRMPQSQQATAIYPQGSAAPMSAHPSSSNAHTNSTDWNSFVVNGFNNTSPPTPEAFTQSQQPQPAVSGDASSGSALDEADDDGEILVGMGLYDVPDKYEADPHLNNYRTTVTSLLGSTFRPQEPIGKGLKLEETWEPPKSEDEEEEEDDGSD